MERIGVPFELAIVASEIGSYKPGPRHWEVFFERTGADRAGHVHVGASLFHDVAPAEELGLRTIWINRLGEEPEPQPDVELHSLDGPRRLAGRARLRVASRRDGSGDDHAAAGDAGGRGRRGGASRRGRGGAARPPVPADGDRRRRLVVGRRPRARLVGAGGRRAAGRSRLVRALRPHRLPRRRRRAGSEVARPRREARRPRRGSGDGGGCGPCADLRAGAGPRGGRAVREPRLHRGAPLLRHGDRADGAGSGALAAGRAGDRDVRGRGRAGVPRRDGRGVPGSLGAPPAAVRAVVGAEAGRARLRPDALVPDPRRRRGGGDRAKRSGAERRRLHRRDRRSPPLARPRPRQGAAPALVRGVPAARPDARHAGRRRRRIRRARRSSTSASACTSRWSAVVFEKALA